MSTEAIAVTRKTKSDAGTPKAAPARLSAFQLSAFAAPGILAGIITGPAASVLPTLYAERYALNMAAIGSILAIARIFDAVIDPIIGHLSDITRSPLGNRKPWIIAGAILSTIAVYELYVPGANGGTTWFLVWTLVVYFAWTLKDIPMNAWAFELSRDPKERARIFGYRVLAMYAAGIIYAILPQMVPASGGQMNFAVLKVLSVGAIIALPLATFASVYFVPRGEVVQKEGIPKIRELFRAIRNNRPFLMILGIYFCAGLCAGMNGTLAFVYFKDYLGLGAAFTAVTLPALVVGPLMTPVWVRIARQFEMLKTAVAVFIIYLVIMACGFFIVPGPAALWLYIAYTVVLVGLYPALTIVMPAIQGNAIDYDEWKTGSNKSGLYSSFLTFLTKVNVAVGTAAGFSLVAAFGYRIGAPHNTEFANIGLRLAETVIPALIMVPAVWLTLKFPIAGRRHEIIQKRLRARARRANPAAIGEN